MRHKTPIDSSFHSDDAKPFNISRNRPAALQVYEDLRDRIVSLSLLPGYGLSRAALAEFYGVSQTPVREAFLKLEKDGLVEVFPQSKTMIAPISVHKVKATHFLRTSLELEVARTLAQTGNKSKIAPAIAVLEQQKSAEMAADAFIHLDREFHLSLFEAAGFSDLWVLLSDQSGHLDRVRQLQLPTPGKIERVIMQHGKIIDAINASDVTLAESHVREHLAGSLQELDSIVSRNDDLFGA